MNTNFQITTNGYVNCDHCRSQPADGNAMRQTQRGMRIRIFCSRCWNALKHLILIGRV